MKLKSMRVRLPLTYAAIALLTALALGGVLFLTLRDYYTQREQQYLMDRAVAIQTILSDMIEADLPPNTLEAQVNSLAFLVQARVRFLDNEGQVQADSGDPTQGDVFSVLPFSPSIDSMGGDVRALESRTTLPPIGVEPLPSQGQPETQAGSGDLQFTASITGTAGTMDTRILFFSQSFRGESEPGVTPPPAGTLVLLSAVPRTVAFSSYDLVAEGQDSRRRSSQVVQLPILDSAGDAAGMLELSEGPALGGAILESVARAAAAAGLVAVVLAAVVGWLVSRQVTGPLTALTQVTGEMAAGDLSARADVLARDEFSILGESFNRMASRIEGTVGTLRKFASDAAHELKTPLTALVTDLELALEEGLSSQERDGYLRRAQGQVQRLERLMDGLLDLSRLEAGSQEGPALPVDLTELLQEASENFAAQAEQHELDFHLELPPEPLIVIGYPGQLLRAVANLLDNAVKFTLPGGSVQLHLSTLGKRWRSAYRIPASACCLRTWTRCSGASTGGATPPLTAGAGWDWPSYRLSSRRTAGGCGPRTTRRAAPVSRSACPRRKSR